MVVYLEGEQIVDTDPTETAQRENTNRQRFDQILRRSREK
jgi:hypothetical protein